MQPVSSRVHLACEGGCASHFLHYPPPHVPLASTRSCVNWNIWEMKFICLPFCSLKLFSHYKISKGHLELRVKIPHSPLSVPFSGHFVRNYWFELKKFFLLDNQFINESYRLYYINIFTVIDCTCPQVLPHYYSGFTSQYITCHTQLLSIFWP